MEKGQITNGKVEKEWTGRKRMKKGGRASEDQKKDEKKDGKRDEKKKDRKKQKTFIRLGSFNLKRRRHRQNMIKRVKKKTMKKPGKEIEMINGKERNDEVHCVKQN